MPRWGASGSLDVGAVQTACEAAIDAKAGTSIPTVVQIQSGLATSSALAALAAKFPDLLDASADVSTGSDAVLVAAVGGQQIRVYGWHATTQNGGTGGSLSFWSGEWFGGTQLYGASVPDAGAMHWEPVNDDVVFSTATGEKLTFRNDAGDTIGVRVYYRLVTP